MTTPASSHSSARRIRFSMSGILFASVFINGATLAPAAEPSTAAPKAQAAAEAEPYYVVQRISITTSAGIQSIPPGTPVTILAKTRSGFKIKTADGIVAVVTDQQISKDVGQANQASDRERAEDAARAAQAQKQAEADAAERRAQVASAEQAVATAQKAVPVANSPSPFPPSRWRPRGTSLDNNRSTSWDGGVPVVGVKVKPYRFKK